MSVVEDFLKCEISQATDLSVEKRLAEIYQVFASESEEAKERRKTIAIINTKQFITVSEAALLIGCGESTLRKKIEETKKHLKLQREHSLSLVGADNDKPKSKSKKKNDEPFDPIPFIDKHKVGIILFEREKLLAWVTKESGKETLQQEVA